MGLLLIVFVVSVLGRLPRTSGSDPALQLALALLATETVHVSTSGDLNVRTFWFVLLFAVTLLHKQRFEAPPPETSTGVATTR